MTASRSARWRRVRSLLAQADRHAARMPRLAELLRLEATAVLNASTRRAWVQNGAAVVRQ